jgi:hypothetical protein
MRHYSRNLPFLFDFFLAWNDIIQPRHGWPFDAAFHRGGLTLFFGSRVHLVIDIHALRAIFRDRPVI